MHHLKLLIISDSLSLDDLTFGRWIQIRLVLLSVWMMAGLSSLNWPSLTGLGLGEAAHLLHIHTLQSRDYHGFPGGQQTPTKWRPTAASQRNFSLADLQHYNLSIQTINVQIRY